MITDEYPPDVGFGNIYQLFEALYNVGFGSLTARGLLAVADRKIFLRRGSQRQRRVLSARPGG